MPRQTTTVVIDGAAYKIEQFPAVEGAEFFDTIQKRLALTLSSLQSGYSVSALTSLLAESDNGADDLEDVIETLFKYVTADGSAVDVDTAFAGDYEALLALMTEVIGFNFGFLFFGNSRFWGESSGESTGTAPAPITRAFEAYSQNHFAYAVLTSELKLVDYYTLHTKCSTEDLYNMYETVLLHNHKSAVYQRQAEAEAQRGR